MHPFKHLFLLLEHLNSSPVTAVQIKTLTNDDPVLLKVCNLVLTSRPTDRAELQLFMHHFDLLSVHDGCRA